MISPNKLLVTTAPFNCRGPRTITIILCAVVTQSPFSIEGGCVCLLGESVRTESPRLDRPDTVSPMVIELQEKYGKLTSSMLPLYNRKAYKITKLYEISNWNTMYFLLIFFRLYTLYSVPNYGEIEIFNSSSIYPALNAKLFSRL